MKRLLVIAGTDSSGGAGLSRDCATAHALGYDVAPVITAVTAQTRATVTAQRLMSAQFVAEQIRAAFTSGPVHAVKIGMLATSEIADAVANVLSSHDFPKVLDPVLASSSGRPLMTGQLPRALLSQVTVITPNLPEAAALTKSPVATCQEEITAQARVIVELGAQAVLIKGGHAEGHASVDHLFETSGRVDFMAPKLPISMRGTGCMLATVIACGLGRGRGLQTACKQAKEYVQSKLNAAYHTEKPR